MAAQVEKPVIEQIRLFLSKEEYEREYAFGKRFTTEEAITLVQTLLLPPLPN